MGAWGLSFHIVDFTSWQGEAAGCLSQPMNDNDRCIQYGLGTISILHGKVDVKPRQIT